MLLKSHSIQCAIELFILTFHSYSRQPPQPPITVVIPICPPPKKTKQKIKTNKTKNKTGEHSNPALCTKELSVSYCQI